MDFPSACEIAKNKQQGASAPPGIRPAKPVTSDDDKLALLLNDGGELVRRLLEFVPRWNRLDWRAHQAARWQRGPVAAEFAPLASRDSIALDDLLCIDDQKSRLVDNTAQFVHGLPANNALLWGARGTGKSSLVHALLNRFAGAGLRLVEVDKQALTDIAAIGAELREEPFRFLLFCDDLSFEAEDDSYKVLKSALEGALFKQFPNMLIYATSNRRHLMPERMADNLTARHVHGELHESEAVEEKISLSDRFGLWLSFRAFRQDDYLRVTRHWLERLAAEHSIAVPWDDALRHAALRWALTRGVRSGRTALHFAKQHVGRTLLNRPAG